MRKHPILGHHRGGIRVVRKSRWCGLVVLAGLLAWVGLVRGEDKKDNENEGYEIRWEVRGKSTRSSEDRAWSESYANHAEAVAEMEAKNRSYGPGGLQAAAPEKPVDMYVHKIRVPKTSADKPTTAKEALENVTLAKKALDKAKEISNGVAAAERKLGDTIKEYADIVKQLYENATKATDNLTSMTGSITEKQFGDVNKLIDGYNKDNDKLDQLGRGAGGGAIPSFPRLSRVTQKDLKAKIVEKTPTVDQEPAKSDSVERMWISTDVPGEYWNLMKGGVGEKGEKGSQYKYDLSWTQKGDEIIIVREDITFVYVRKGDRLIGKAQYISGHPEEPYNFKPKDLKK
jgi:hypothetical protein